MGLAMSSPGRPNDDQPQIDSSVLPMPTDIPAELASIAKEVHVLFENVLWSAQGQFEQMKLWRSMNVVLGVPAAVLAAVSGGTGLAAESSTKTPAILALVAAGFGAALTTLNPSRRVSQSQASASAFLELQTTARQLLTVDLAMMDRDTARGELATLTSRRDEVNRTADPPSWYAYWRASRNIKKGRQSNEVHSKRK
jgi:hypothetical protein